MLNSHDWARIVSRAQEAYRLRRWARVMRDMGLPAHRLDARATRAERVVLTIARNAGVML